MRERPLTRMMATGRADRSAVITFPRGWYALADRREQVGIDAHYGSFGVSALALGLVVVAAAMHAGWNALAKRSGDSLAFMWSFTVASLVIYAIPFAILIVDNPPDWDGLRFV
ncbi:MAG: hypothetical protein ACRDJW_13345, partial [Thermomicrobiales bacterium]